MTKLAPKPRAIDKAIDLTVGIEHEEFNGANHFRQAVWINPMHVSSDCLRCSFNRVAEAAEAPVVAAARCRSAPEVAVGR